MWCPVFFRPFQLAVRRDSNVPCWKWPGLSQSTSRAEPREAPVCRGGFFDEFGTWELWLLPSCLGVGAVRGSPGSPDPRKKRGDIIVIFYDILQIIWETPSLTTCAPRIPRVPGVQICLRPVACDLGLWRPLWWKRGWTAIPQRRRSAARWRSSSVKRLLPAGDVRMTWATSGRIKSEKSLER